MPRRNQNRTRYEPSKQSSYGKEVASSIFWGAFVIPVGALLIAMLFGVQIDNAPVIILGMGIAVVIFGGGIAIGEAILRFIKFDDARKAISRFIKFDDPRKDKPDDPRKDKPAKSPLPSPTPADLIDKNATYTLSSDGELMKVVDDEAPPPAITFKVNGDEQM